MNLKTISAKQGEYIDAEVTKKKLLEMNQRGLLSSIFVDKEGKHLISLGYQIYEQISAWLDSLAQVYSSIAKLDTIGRSSYYNPDLTVCNDFHQSGYCFF